MHFRFHRKLAKTREIITLTNNKFDSLKMLYLPTILTICLKIGPCNQELNPKNTKKVEVMRQNRPPVFRLQLHCKIHIK